MKVKNDFCSKLFLGPIFTMAAGLLLTFGLILVGSVVCQQTEVEAKTKAKGITVKKIDQKTAKKVHQRLLKGKAFTIRFKGSEKSFYKKFQKLTKKVAKQTDVGFDVFPICAQDSGYYGHAGFDKQDNKPKKSGKYTKFLVKKAYCEEYIYGIKFAEREYGAMKAYVNETLTNAERMLNLATDNEVREVLSSLKLESKLAGTQYVISEYKELRDYLQRTKFRDLSDTMKARVVLEVGGSHEDSYNNWVKVSMTRKSAGFKRCNGFKDLYKRKAYGRPIYITHVICKMCAVYNIGEFDCIDGPDSYRRTVARVKMKTCSGKVRYGVYLDGTFDHYNEYAGCKTEEAFVRYRKRYKGSKKIKRISKTNEIKQRLALNSSRYDFGTASGKAISLIIYGPVLDRAEW